MRLSLPAGTRLGPYQVLSAIGAGGMGEVYRARDTKLNRDVAIKVLRPSVANDPDRLARFSREAQVLASLNHPNIAHIHGIEEADGVTALVLELVEGEDLERRIARGPLPLDEALSIAKQIADALEAAHEQGIVHRDLKPANIKLRPDGTVKVLDFGLAKAIEPSIAVEQSDSPTITSPAVTLSGVILGTAAYMSPEQAAGKPVDKRSDVWSFGVVVLEMLSGRAVFAGETVTHVLAAVLKTEPDWTTLPSNTPAPIRRLLRRCLEKDRKRRLDSVADARLEIDEARSGVSGVDVVGGNERGARRSVRSLVAAFVIGGVLVGFAMWAVYGSSRITSSADVARFAIADSERVIMSRRRGDLALSPDGRTLAFVGYGEGGARIWLRALDALEPRSLVGTEGAAGLSWSPDGRSLAFIASQRLKKVSVSGGTPEVLAPTRGGETAWGPNETILFIGNGLSRIPVSGGAPARLMDGPLDHLPGGPELLPDGRNYLIAIESADPAKAGTFVVALDGNQRTRLLVFPTVAHYADGHLLFVRDRVLYAQAFDLSRSQLRGEPVPLEKNVAPAFTASRQGVIAYAPLGGGDQQVLWMDRDGHIQERLDQAAGGTRLRLSPDGKRLAMVLRADVWVLELARGVLSRITSGGGLAPLWSSDGQRIVFFRNRAGRNGRDLIVETPVLSTGKEVVLREPTGDHAHPTDVSTDGRYLIYEGEQEEGSDIWVARLTGDRQATVYAKTATVETQGTLSPDVHWLAYTSDTSGRFEVYVQGFPLPGPRIQVSTEGGHSARWRRDGRELFYLAPDGTLMAVSVRASQPIEFSKPAPLFQFFTSLNQGIPVQTPSYDVTADGQRFIVSAVVRRTDPSVNVLLNWPRLLTK